KNAVMYDKTVSEGAGQVRAISRLALDATIKTGKINPLYEAIDDLFRKTGKELKQALRIAIASTASGGTGSGIILPLAMLIRDYVNNKYPNISLMIRMLIMLPETLDSVITSTTEKESQRRNAYATIKELNAFMMKGSGFFEIDPDLKRYMPLHIDVPQAARDELKSLSLLPCDFCFLMDGQDAEDSTLDNLNQYIEQAAQALYEQNIGPMQRNAFSVEDNIIKEISNRGNLGRNRFGGIGASVLRYPYGDVADYVAYGWAEDAIGGEGDAQKWGKYDAKWRTQQAEAKKKGLPQTEWPQRGDTYVSVLENATDSFSKAIYQKYLDREEERIDEYLSAVRDYALKGFNGNSLIGGIASTVNHLAKEIDYSIDTNRGKAVENLGHLRNYEMIIRENADKIAHNVIGGIYENERRTIVEDEPYMIEKLMKNDLGECVHPNAARFLLYKVRSTFESKMQEIQTQLDKNRKELEKYQPTADNAMFDTSATRKETETNMDELAAAETEKLSDVHEKLNNYFPKYYKAIKQAGDLTVEMAAYREGRSYVDDLCKEYEKFFGTFTEKVAMMKRKGDDLVEALAFKKGNSVYNVCATREMMDEMKRSTASMASEGSLLDSELNGQIFDAVKDNVRFNREILNEDVVEEDKSVDIFDKILLDYFRLNVRKNCESLNLNIVEALAMEYRLQSRIKAREAMGGEGKIIDHIRPEDSLRHIEEMIAMGGRLAAPGISRAKMEEPREVRVVSYNQSLNDMRNYRMDTLFAKGTSAVATDTVSKYEMHFFIALYNLTPDKLAKFACPTTTETHSKDAGLYHNAYTSYGKNIGPDSTKNMVISTHIDKRWDSIAFMPEMDLKYQEQKLMKIHQALVYAMIYGAVRFRKYSNASGGKMVYRYEDSEERISELIVSNGTLCDEFYEILDSMYIDAALVEDIEVIKEKRRDRDSVRNSNYEDTEFAAALNAFNISEAHRDDGAPEEGERSSIFEIPLAYHNSLPNSHQYGNTVVALVDAVIKTLEDELLRWEKADDAKFMLCEKLDEQFRLLMSNYDKYEKLRNNTVAEENTVIDTIYRKIKGVMMQVPEPKDFEERLRNLRALIK
ncbi:MAG: hypothetical protein II126_02770, partial [Erysipelotrichaceae bacterium]|nr:hypothetical protein [Erysipelotrichaceae bacterium]